MADQTYFQRILRWLQSHRLFARGLIALAVIGSLVGMLSTVTTIGDFYKDNLKNDEPPGLLLEPDLMTPGPPPTSYAYLYHVIDSDIEQLAGNPDSLEIFICFKNKFQKNQIPLRTKDHVGPLTKIDTHTT